MKGGGSVVIRVRRIYDAPEPEDGRRILVDRLWPRGLTKNKARVDLWLKDVAPSDALRKWFGHDPVKWRAFRTRYFRELGKRRDEVGALRKETRAGTVTLLFGARDTEHNNAVALKEFLAGRRNQR